MPLPRLGSGLRETTQATLLLLQFDDNLRKKKESNSWCLDDCLPAEDCPLAELDTTVSACTKEVFLSAICNG